MHCAASLQSRTARSAGYGAELLFGKPVQQLLAPSTERAPQVEQLLEPAEMASPSAQPQYFSHARQYMAMCLAVKDQVGRPPEQRNSLWVAGMPVCVCDQVA